jgi:hypothetical protein
MELNERCYLNVSIGAYIARYLKKNHVQLIPAKIPSCFLSYIIWDALDDGAYINKSR